MEKVILMNAWIFRILRYVKSKRGYQNQMCQNGHLSHHHFSPVLPVYKISLGCAIRLVLNYALICKDTEKVHEFKDDWNKLGDAIMILVDKGTVDDLNRMFEPKRQQRKKKILTQRLQ